MIRRLFRGFPLQCLMVGLIIGCALILVREAGLFQPVELRSYNVLLQLRSDSSLQTNPLVLIEISEQDIQALGRYPISDAQLAEVLNALAGSQPRAIGLDIYRDFEVPPGREAMHRVLSQHQNIIGIMKMGGRNTPGTPPPPLLMGTERVGFSDIPVDPDGIVRRGLLYQDGSQEVVPSFALQLALRYLAGDGIVPKPDPEDARFLRLGPTTLMPFRSNDGGYIRADDGGYQILMHFTPADLAFPVFSLQAVQRGEISSETLQGKIVLIGVAADSVPDVFHSPLGKPLPGVEVHAALTNQLIRAGEGRYARLAVLNESAEGLLILMCGIVGGWVGKSIRSVWGYSWKNLSGIFLMAGMNAFFFFQGWWLPGIPAGLSFVIASSAVTAMVVGRERSDRKVLQQLFQRYVSPQVASRIWEERDQFMDGGRPRSQTMTATVLFMDMQGYTSAAERLTPERLMAWVNSYLEAMAQTILHHGGVIDDYAGDGIKANFGVPIPNRSEEAVRQEALHAARCALAMVDRFLQLNEERRFKNDPTVGIRIGIATGEVVAGSLGSSQRLKYTTVGDTVNIAARLEGLDRTIIPASREFGYRILVDDRTERLTKDALHFQAFGDIRVKGREKPVRVFNLIRSGDPVKAAQL